MATAFLTPKNNAYSTLASGINDAVEAFTVATGEGARFPSSNFNVSIDSEIIHVVSRATDVFTCTGGRGAESTAAASHSAAAAVNLYITAKALSDLNTAVNALETGKRNIIINGGFTINQRVYVSAAALAAGVYGHDRWKGGAGGGDYSFTQLASPTTITIAANKTLIQVVEDKMVYGGTYVLSWTGTCQARYAINSATPAGAYADSPITISGQNAGTTMSVEFGNGAASGTLGLVQLELGSVVTTFEFRHYSYELELCKRYAEWVACEDGAAQLAAGFASTTTKLWATLLFTEKRVKPTVTFSRVDGFRVSIKGDSNFVTSAMAASQHTKKACRVDATGAGSLVDGGGGCLNFNENSDWIGLDSEL